MKKSQLAVVMGHVFAHCAALREAGQKEYAHDDDNAFANFERVAERQKLDRRQVLMTYFEKHIDGIHSFIQGHKSQREDVRGRIRDAIVYMVILHGMIDEDEGIDIAEASPASVRLDVFTRDMAQHGILMNPDQLDQLRAIFDAQGEQFKEARERARAADERAASGRPEHVRTLTAKELDDMMRGALRNPRSSAVMVELPNGESIPAQTVSIVNNQGDGRQVVIVSTLPPNS